MFSCPVMTKLCPLLNKPCIEAECNFWAEITTKPEDTDIPGYKLTDCAIRVIAGYSGSKLGMSSLEARAYKNNLGFQDL
jgi:hypothetical protein